MAKHSARNGAGRQMHVLDQGSRRGTNRTSKDNQNCNTNKTGQRSYTEITKAKYIRLYMLGNTEEFSAMLHIVWCVKSPFKDCCVYNWMHLHLIRSLATLTLSE